MFWSVIYLFILQCDICCLVFCCIVSASVLSMFISGLCHDVFTCFQFYPWFSVVSSRLFSTKPYFSLEVPRLSSASVMEVAGWVSRNGKRDGVLFYREKRNYYHSGSGSGICAVEGNLKKYCIPAKRLCCMAHALCLLRQRASFSHGNCRLS